MLPIIPLVLIFGGGWFGYKLIKPKKNTNPNGTNTSTGSGTKSNQSTFNPVNDNIFNKPQTPQTPTETTQIIAGKAVVFPIKKGAKGDVVSTIQKELIKLGYLKISNPTGEFGSQTENALFQATGKREVTIEMYRAYFGLNENTLWLSNIMSTVWINPF